MFQKPQEEEREPTPPPEEELTSNDLGRIESEVEDLQDQFDKAVVEKHSLELELTSMKERLKAATDLMQRCGGYFLDLFFIHQSFNS